MTSQMTPLSEKELQAAIPRGWNMAIVIPTRQHDPMEIAETAEW